MKLSTDQIEELTTKAVVSALDTIDEATDGDTMRYSGSCGDNLAYKLHQLIESCLKRQYGTEN